MPDPIRLDQLHARLLRAAHQGELYRSGYDDYIGDGDQPVTDATVDLVNAGLIQLTDTDPDATTTSYRTTTTGEFMLAEGAIWRV